MAVSLKGLQKKLIEFEEQLENQKRTLKNDMADLEKDIAEFEKLSGVEYSWAVAKDKKSDLDSRRTNLTDDEYKLLRVINSISMTSSFIQSTQKSMKKLEQNITKQNQKIADYLETNAIESTTVKNKKDLKVILDFLDRWVAEAYDWYMSNAEQYFEDRELMLEAEDEKTKAIYQARMANNDVKNIIYQFHSVTLKSFEKKIVVTLEDEKNRKYDKFIAQVEKYVGIITNVEHLQFSEKNEIEGVVEGTEGKARVFTIGAGGYNIQRYHYRVLVHPIK